MRKPVNGMAAVPLITNSACRIIASVTPAGDEPVNSLVDAKVWIESAVPVHGGQPFVERHYEILPTVNAVAATAMVTLYFTQQEFDDFNAHAASGLNLPPGHADIVGIANLRIAKYTEFSSDGSGLPVSYAGETTVIDPVDSDIQWNSTLNHWEISFAVSGFGGFVVQTAVNALPLDLLLFSGKPRDADAISTWQTANEVNTHHFEVERSTDGNRFSKAGSITALDNATSNHYSFVDENAMTLAGILYYRLRIVDADGSYYYSRTIALNGAPSSRISLYPNPADNILVFGLDDSRLLGSSVVITDMQGRRFKQITLGSMQRK